MGLAQRQPHGSKASGITDKVPYSMRHSFAAWSLTLRIDPNRLVRLMGHGTKKMIYEGYGDYIEGLEEDFWLILEYYGRDFAQPKMKQSATMIEYQNGFNFHPLNSAATVQFSPTKLRPELPLKTFFVIVLVIVGAYLQES